MVARVKQKQKNKADQQNTVQLQTKKRRKILNMALHDATCEGRRRRGGCTRQSKKTEGKDGRGKYQERERESYKKRRKTDRKLYKKDSEAFYVENE